MPSIDATRLLLFADGPRAAEALSAQKIRRYRLARLRLDGTREERSTPRDASLKRAHT